MRLQGECYCELLRGSKSYNNRRKEKGRESSGKTMRKGAHGTQAALARYHACCGLALYSSYKARLKKLISDSFSVQGRAEASITNALAGKGAGEKDGNGPIPTEASVALSSSRMSSSVSWLMIRSMV